MPSSSYHYNNPTITSGVILNPSAIRENCTACGKTPESMIIFHEEFESLVIT